MKRKEFFLQKQASPLAGQDFPARPITPGIEDRCFTHIIKVEPLLVLDLATSQGPLIFKSDVDTIFQVESHNGCFQRES